MLRCAVALLVAVVALLPGSPRNARAAECAHGLCVEDDTAPLDPACDPCVKQICNHPDHGFCCEFGWDFTCVDQVLEICGDPICEAACAHSPCESGEALAPACHPCVASICADDPSCCKSEWRERCAQQVETRCGIGCLPSSDRCDDAVFLAPVPETTVFGSLVDAGKDTVWYSYTPPAPGTLRINTCRTNHAFGIDTVLSVHSGCPGGRGTEIAFNDDWRVPDPDSDPTACEDPVELGDYLDSAVAIPVGGVGDPTLRVNQNVRIRVTRFQDSAPSDFVLNVVPEPGYGWLRLTALVSLAALTGRRHQ
jgi:hypothetical protein